jgi:transposase
MPKKFPPEFKRDVVRVARRGDLTVLEVAADFDVSKESVRRWMRQADIDDGVKDGQTSTEQTELVQLRRDEAPVGDGDRDLASGGGVLRRWGRSQNGALLTLLWVVRRASNETRRPVPRFSGAEA